MANPHRGEVDLKTDRGEYTLRLTLGALAELESDLEADGIVGVAERFETGAIRSVDLIALLAAGIRGGGGSLSHDEVSALAIEGGAAGAAAVAAALLALTFRSAP